MSPAITMMGCRSTICRSGQPHQHVVVNVDKLVRASRDAQPRRSINECALVNGDGPPVARASRLPGKPAGT